MDDYEEQILNSGINKSDVDSFKNKIESCMKHMCAEYNFEPNNEDGLIDTMQHMMFKTIVTHCQELNEDVKTMFNNFYSDFDNPKSSKAQGSLQVLLGSAHAINFKEEGVNRDITILSSKIMERNYNNMDR